MSNSNDSQDERALIDLNEYGFYFYMPDSIAVKNELGYFLKNHKIETYSYVAPTLLGEKNFDKFLSYTFSFFADGKEYFIIKHPFDEYFRTNSKILREKRLIAHHIDISVMSWNKEGFPYLRTSEEVELELLTIRNLNKWVDVFFDAFDYPNDLRKYISSMVNKQAENGIEFYVGKASGKDVSCFCVFRQQPYHGFYGVGTKHKFRRKGYASITLSNYIESIIKSDTSSKFCLQVQSRSSAERLYKKIGFEKSFSLKRFDWDPSTLGPIS
ncbi:MAG: hypothetical protein HGN29_04160 [Asgard group archaeon]|nr:hypothetical protein [Asgard group archaeon]